MSEAPVPLTRRQRYRLSLNALYLPGYDRLCAALGDAWQPYSGFRSIQAQDILYAQGRTSPGKIVTKAKGGESAHDWGCASDWTIWVNEIPTWPEEDDPCWKEFILAVQNAGLRPGAEFGDRDHAELKIAHPWPSVLAVYRDKGAEVAQAFIQASML